MKMAFRISKFVGHGQCNAEIEIHNMLKEKTQITNLSFHLINRKIRTL